VIKRYLPPATPYERALVHPSLNEAFYRTLDPVALLAQMRDLKMSWASALISGLESQR